MRQNAFAMPQARGAPLGSLQRSPRLPGGGEWGKGMQRGRDGKGGNKLEKVRGGEWNLGEFAPLVLERETPLTRGRTMPRDSF